MASSVDSAFKKFNDDFVNLLADRTKKARSSRDWLIEQLEKLPERVDDFPKPYDEMHIKFGSFSRNTKIQPLDDIDLIFTFSAEKSTYSTVSYGILYKLQAGENAVKLKALCDDQGFINSRKVINKLVSSLNEIDQYKSADLHRKQEAATLQLSTYEWNFDIVPAFYTNTGYYLIPDGNGHWKATDPRIDQEKVTNINQKHGGAILQIIRTLKYWNIRASMPTISSYLLENMILNYFNNKADISKFIDVNIILFWNHLSTAIFLPVDDPKKFQGDLNDISYEDRLKISEKATDAYSKGYEANKIETEEKNQEKAINKWREIFGNDFPKYG